MNTFIHLFSSIEKFMEQHNLIPDKSTIVLGLSGGPDSVFLFHLLAPLHQKKLIKLVVAHLDHEWRPDSDQDIIFCKQMAKKFDCHFVTKKMITIHFAIE